MRNATSYLRQRSDRRRAAINCPERVAEATAAEQTTVQHRFDDEPTIIKPYRLRNSCPLK